MPPHKEIQPKKKKEKKTELKMNGAYHLQRCNTSHVGYRRGKGTRGEIVAAFRINLLEPLVLGKKFLEAPKTFESESFSNACHVGQTMF